MPKSTITYWNALTPDHQGQWTPFWAGNLYCLSPSSDILSSKAVPHSGK